MIYHAHELAFLDAIQAAAIVGGLKNISENHENSTKVQKSFAEHIMLFDPINVAGRLLDHSVSISKAPLQSSPKWRSLS
jgi:hypothetical protein